jgi:hypothetical protein
VWVFYDNIVCALVGRQPITEHLLINETIMYRLLGYKFALSPYFRIKISAY